jgi:hypothetical protein
MIMAPRNIGDPPVSAYDASNSGELVARMMPSVEVAPTTPPRSP